MRTQPNNIVARAYSTLLLVHLLVLSGCGGETPVVYNGPKVVGLSLQWVHPRLPASQPVRIDDAATATRLASVFDGFYLPLKGEPWDCPMYDVVVTLHREDGISTDLKVCLPREDFFPGMWKHPDGVLNYFNAYKLQQRLLVNILTPYIPASSVYPRTMTIRPRIVEIKGIPDFTDSDYKVGDISPEDFRQGYE